MFDPSLQVRALEGGGLGGDDANLERASSGNSRAADDELLQHPSNAAAPPPPPAAPPPAAPRAAEEPQQPQPPMGEAQPAGPGIGPRKWADEELVLVEPDLSARMGAGGQREPHPIAVKVPRSVLSGGRPPPPLPAFRYITGNRLSSDTQAMVDAVRRGRTSGTGTYRYGRKGPLGALPPPKSAPCQCAGECAPFARKPLAERSLRIECGDRCACPSGQNGEWRARTARRTKRPVVAPLAEAHLCRCRSRSCVAMNDPLHQSRDP